ncbi:hypothetical protein WJX72_000201 [[Myrmecia] bisecta]|uniref:Protein CASP n=1 Tax=[Myrmecia] bisecta TaxID=41462 RepID=A0AAW1Q1Q6_9CHLO
MVQACYAAETLAASLRQQLAQAQECEAAARQQLAALGEGQAEGMAEAQRQVAGAQQAAADAQAEMEIMREAMQHAKVAALEKHTHELSWQVAMLTRTGDGAQPARRPGAVPEPVQSEPGQGTLPGVVGLLLRHRKKLVVVYLVVLHALVYFALTHGVFGSMAGDYGVASTTAGAKPMQQLADREFASAVDVMSMPHAVTA